jgi:hypothetical protein
LQSKFGGTPEEVKERKDKNQDRRNSPQRHREQEGLKPEVN